MSNNIIESYFSAGFPQEIAKIVVEKVLDRGEWTDLYALRRTCKGLQEVVDSILERRKAQILEGASLSSVERSIVQQARARGGPALFFFRRLRTSFSIKKRDSITPDLYALQRLYRREEDRALMSFYLGLKELPAMKQAKAMRKWLAENPNACSTVLEVCLTSHDDQSKIRRLPPEMIEACPKLRTMTVNDELVCALPETISALKELRALKCANNQLTALPPTFGALQRLRILDLSKNPLDALPPVICTLTELTSLALSRCCLTEVPREVSRLQNLSVLQLSENRFGAMPSALCTLRQLETLLLCSCDLTEVPQEISRLQNLTVLCLKSGKLRTLPAEISRLQALQQLDISFNQFTSFPLAVCKLPRLWKLECAYNKLTRIPRELEKAQRLRDLGVCGNPLIGIPQTVLHRVMPFMFRSKERNYQWWDGEDLLRLEEEARYRPSSPLGILYKTICLQKGVAAEEKAFTRLSEADQSRIEEQMRIEEEPPRTEEGAPICGKRLRSEDRERFHRAVFDSIREQYEALSRKSRDRVDERICELADWPEGSRDLPLVRARYVMKNRMRLADVMADVEAQRAKKRKK